MRIYAIPGLGTNRVIFDSIKIKGHDFTVLQWPPLKRDYTMEDYARCFLDQIDTREPFMLLGLSFGGMIAVELGKILQPKKIILISSAKTREDLPKWIRLLKYFPAYKILPDKFIRKISYQARWLLGFMVEDFHALADMIRDMPEDYFRCTIQYIINWRNTEIPKNCILIHGSGDKLLWLRQNKTEYVIEKGSHAMVLTKAEEINKILEEVLKEPI
jgi:pimeloyl-ACP methyl ester carboxylesterase